MKYYVTTPIYYVNDVPHIGHAYTTLAADILAQWHRLHNDNVFFLTGTDEHGAKIVQASAKLNQSPREFCDHISAQFKEAWDKLGIRYDKFIRTTDPKHEKTVQVFLDRLHRVGAIYKNKYEGLYCVPCEKFVSEADLVNGCCPDHKIAPALHSEENYFFRLSAYRDQLLDVLTNPSNPQYIQVLPEERRNEIVGKLKTGLEDISISRAALEWGVPLPFDNSQTAYVWIDALINYISALGFAEDAPAFKEFWPCDLHLMAKDILWFHSVIWPAMLLAAGLPLPKRVFAHGFFTINGDKMSKTLGNVIRPQDLISRFGVESSRYLVLALFPFGIDGDISWDALTDRYNVDLANNLGNLVSRTLTMVEKYNNSVTPENPGSPFSIACDLAPIAVSFDKVQLHLVIEQLQRAIDKANRYIEEKAPWKMAKEQNPELPAVLFSLLHNLRLLSFYLQPFMPQTCSAIWERLGETGSIEEAAKKFFSGDAAIALPRGGAVTSKGSILFPRIVDPAKQQAQTTKKK